MNKPFAEQQPRLPGKCGSWLSAVADRIFRRSPPSEEILQILSELEYNKGYFPAQAVAAAVQHKREITPHLLRIIRETTRNAAEVLKKEDYFAHIYAIFLLAQFREKRAYPLIVEFLRLPGDTVEDLLGDTITEDLDRILVSVCGGDLKPIKTLVADQDVNEWVRSAGVDVFKIMVFNNLIQRDDAIKYYRHLLNGGLEKGPSQALNSVVTCAVDLHPAELIQDIRKAYDEGFVDDMIIGLDEVERDLARDRETVMDEWKEADRGLIDDVVDDISWWACFEDDTGDNDDDFDDEMDDDYEADGTPYYAGSREYSNAEPFVRSDPKIGRNGPCPCGSGKKYKKCCLVQ